MKFTKPTLDYSTSTSIKLDFAKFKEEVTGVKFDSDTEAELELIVNANIPEWKGFTND